MPKPMRKRKAIGMSFLGAGCLLFGASFFMYLNGWVWPWGFGVGGVLIVLGAIQGLRPTTALEREFLDPNYDRRPFLVKSEQFSKRVAKLQRDAPLLVTDEMANTLNNIHRELNKGETREESIYEDAAQKKELLRLKVAKLENGNTSLVFRGRTELMAMLDQP